MGRRVFSANGHHAHALSPDVNSHDMALGPDDGFFLCKAGEAFH
jgi:hypothetical protein